MLVLLVNQPFDLADLLWQRGFEVCTAVGGDHALETALPFAPDAAVLDVDDLAVALKTLAADPYPRVRLEAVRAASFFDEPEALEVALISAEHPTDVYLDWKRYDTTPLGTPQAFDEIMGVVRIKF